MPTPGFVLFVEWKCLAMAGCECKLTDNNAVFVSFIKRPAEDSGVNQVEFAKQMTDDINFLQIQLQRCKQVMQN